MAKAQTSQLILDNSVKPHKEIDAIYKKFNEAYKTLKPEMVADLYTENAAYLQPDSGVITGKDYILKNFTNFFNNVRNNGRDITISFQIFQRKVEKKIGYDIGIYTVTSYRNEKKIGQSKGKVLPIWIQAD